MVGDLFFLHLKSEKSANFEHKRGVPGKGKTENFGCFMAFSRSPVLPIFQTENLGDFDGFQPFRMRTFQILRFAEIEINPCNSTSNTGTKKSRMACHHTASRQKNGGKDQDRTGDTRIFSPLLYQLSYPATWDQYLIGYDSSNIHPFCDLSSRFLKKSRFFQAEENVFYGGLQLEMMFLQLSISIRNCKKNDKRLQRIVKKYKKFVKLKRSVCRLFF